MHGNGKNRHLSNDLPASVTNAFAGYTVRRDEAHKLSSKGNIVFPTAIGVEREREMTQATQQAGKSRTINRDDDRASRWKIFPMSDEQGDQIDEARSQDDQTQLQEYSYRQSEHSHCGPTTFYRNDTSGFLGELKEVEGLLYKKARTTSKIDFPPPNKKKSNKTTASDSNKMDIDCILSNAEVTPDAMTEKPVRKPHDQTKLIVDVKDFVETFSEIRKPIYHGEKKKITVLPEPSDELEHLLDRAYTKRQTEETTIATTTETVVVAETTIEIDSTEQTTSLEKIPNVCEIAMAVPLADGVSEEASTDEAARHETVESDDTAAKISDEQLIAQVDDSIVQAESFVELTQSRVDQTVVVEIDQAENNVERDIVANMVEIETKSDIVIEDCKNANDIVSDSVDVVIKSETVKAVLPHFLERFEELADDQCGCLAEYIKSRVYNGNRLIAFCGMKRGVGCSTMTLLAARGMAKHGLKTAIIDINFEFPQLNAVMTGRQETANNWVDILHGKIDWESVALTPEVSPLLTVFPLAENSLANWSRHEPELLQQATNDLVATLHEHFDLVLLDCGCFDETCAEITWGELELFQPDGVVLIYSPKETSVDTLIPCCREIAAEGLEVFGVAENFV